MDNKQHLDMEGVRRKKSNYLGVSILVLSVILAACVGSLIYLSVRPSTSTDCSSSVTERHVSDKRHHIEDYPTHNETPSPRNYEAATSTVKDEAHVTLRDEDGNEVSEDIEYDETRDIGVFWGSDGSFVLEDFKKGINIVKNPKTGNCYVVPVGTNKTEGQELKNFVKTYSGDEINVRRGRTYSVNVLPGLIADTSFLPPEAQEQCATFHWLSVVGEGSYDEALRQKRDVCADYDCYRTGAIWIRTSDGAVFDEYICFRVSDEYEC